MQALTLIQLAAREYNDVGYERIAKDAASAAVTNGANWLDWLNDAQRAVVLVRPDAKSSTQSVLLAGGTKQSLPASGIRLLSATRNMGSAGTSPGKTIRFADRGVEDMVDPYWHTATAKSVIRDVLYDEKRDPTTFWVSPPATSAPAVYIELVMSKNPTDVTTPTGSIDLADIYSTAIQHWMLYRAYALATQAQGQFARAQSYFKAFFETLGVKLQGEMFQASNAPNTLEAARAGR